MCEYNYDGYMYLRVKLKNPFIIIFKISSWIAIFGYIGYILYEGGFKQFADDGQSINVIKQFGNIETKFNKSDLDQVYNDDEYILYNSTWDSEGDLHFSPSDALFIPTNIRITPNQKRGICADYPSHSTICKPESPTTKCKKQPTSWSVSDDFPPTSGIQTGNCIKFQNKKFETHTYTCEYKGWCPPGTRELPSTKVAIFNDSRHFVAKIRSSVYFPHFDLSLTTDTPENDPDHNCIYDPGSKQKCTVYRIEDMVDMVNKTEFRFDDIKMHGGVIKINIDWSCNLWIFKPFNLEMPFFNTYRNATYINEICQPTVKFTGMKKCQNNFKTSKLGHGLPAKTTECTKTKAYYFQSSNDPLKFTRTLYKVYGITFYTETTTNVCKFDLFNVILILTALGGMLQASDTIFYLLFSGFQQWFDWPCFCCRDTVSILNSEDYNNSLIREFAVTVEDVVENMVPRDQPDMDNVLNQVITRRQRTSNGYSQVPVEVV